SQAERDDAAAGPNIHDATVCNLRFEIGKKQLHEVFRFGSRHQRSLVAEKSAPAKLDGAEQMLKRFARSALLHQIAQRRQFRFVKLTLEFQIQHDSFPAEHMREQVFCIQTWPLDVALLKIARRRLKDFEHSHPA